MLRGYARTWDGWLDLVREHARAGDLKAMENGAGNYGKDMRCTWGRVGGWNLTKDVRELTSG